MRAIISRNESRAIQECRKCTVRSSGASTMFWGTKTEKELLRKTGLGKPVVVKEVDKYVPIMVVWVPAVVLNAGLNQPNVQV